MHPGAAGSRFDAEVGSTLIAAACSPGFGEAVLTAAQRIGSVDEVYAYCMENGGAPETLLSSSILGDSDIRAQHHAHRFFRHDPLSQSLAHTAVGSGFAHIVRAVDIGPYDYRAICFDAPQFAEKLCFGWRGQTRTLVLNFYRRAKATKSQATPVLSDFSGLADVALSILAHSHKSADRLPLVERVERHLANTYPMLSPRERQVCARTLAGWTASRIAQSLSIRHGTVLTYRQRAYQRLGYSGVSDFLDMMVH